MNVFVNFSNHPSNMWSQEQINSAHRYGEIVDIEFPEVDPLASEDNIATLGDIFIEKIKQYSPTSVLCQGEFTLTYYVVNKLLHEGITCVSACTERKSIEKQMEDGSIKKETIFKFVAFRKYQEIEGKNEQKK